MADIGTGSGAIAVALAVNVPGVTVYAVDVSDAALAVAAQNVWRYGLGEQVQLLPGNLLDPLPGPVDVIVANLPYVATADLPHCRARCASTSRCWRSTAARTGWRSSGLLARWLRRRDARKLRPGGRIYLEIGAGQGDAARALVQDSCPMPKSRLCWTTPSWTAADRGVAASASQLTKPRQCTAS